MPPSSREIIKQLEAADWYLVKVVGDHWQFKHPVKPGKVTVQHPKKDIPVHIVHSIEKQSGEKIS